MPDFTYHSTTGIHYAKAGAGPAVVLLHGFPLSGSIWHGIGRRLARSFTVLVPDFPGCGLSPFLAPTDMDDLASLILGILDHENIPQAVLAGHSIGGYVALRFAARWPQRLSGLSLVHSTPLADDPDKINNRLKAIQIIQNGGRAAFLSQMVPNLFSQVFKQSNAATIEDTLNLASLCPPESLISFYHAMIGRHDHTALLASANFPVQWILGVNDNLIFYKKMMELCTIAQVNFVHGYTNCGHMAMLEAPDLLKTDLESFVNYCSTTPVSI